MAQTWIKCEKGHYTTGPTGALYETRKVGKRWVSLITRPGTSRAERCFDTDTKTEQAAKVECLEHIDQGDLIP
jgi:hypothetical protein